MSYEGITWKDYPETDTPVSATNLNIMNKGISDNDAAITTLTAKEESVETRLAALEAVKGELLWENESPTTAFAAQTVSWVSSKNYTGVLIVSKAAAAIATRGIHTDMKVFTVINSLIFEEYRGIMYNSSENSIAFEGGAYSKSDSSSGQNDEYLIPLYIYGLF